MQFVRVALIVIMCILFGSVQTHAQTLTELNDLSNIKIDSYSDEEIASFYDKAIESGMTEAQLYKFAVDKGMPTAEMVKFKARIQAIYPPQKLTVKKKTDTNLDKSTDIDKEKDDVHAYDTAKQALPQQRFENDLTIFGAELFTKNSMAFEPNLRIPTPAGYILGPDDEIILIVYGYSEKSYNLKVNEEGFVYIQSVGPVYVNGLTIEQASEKIKTKLASTVYKAIRSGQTKVQLSLGKIRSIRVTVIGEAKKPGSYTVSSLTTLFNALYLCGGPTEAGSYRKIELIRGNEIKRTADLYNYLLKGNQKDNILLQEGDVIRIPYYKTRVSVSGEVRRKGKYEILEKETFKDLLDFCGGLKDNAYKASVSVVRITDKNKVMIDLDANEFGSFNPQGSDEFIVGKLNNRFENRIQITGSVFRPGPYQLISGMTVKDLIEKAGGITEDAYTKRMTIFRTNPNLTPTSLSVDLDSVLQFNKNVGLIRDDSIVVHSIFEYKENFKVSVIGQVRKPGDYKWRENLTLRDILLSTGGITDFGDSATIEISRRIRNADVTKSNHLQTSIYVVNISSDKDTLKDILLNPFDVIIVKNLAGYIRQRSVLIQGEVMSPGQYTLSKSGERISDIFKRVGGFKASADTTSVTIRRYIRSELSIEEREKIFKRVLNLNQDSLTANDRLKTEVYKTYDLISINLGLALSDPQRSENLILEDGDIITVDRNTNIVKVSGEVNFPTLIPFDKNKKLKYYIKRAGNFTNNARKIRTMVIYPDGKAKSVRKILFFKSYPHVTARSEIYIPPHINRSKNRITTGEWALIVSSLGIVANVIISSRK